MGPRAHIPPRLAVAAAAALAAGTAGALEWQTRPRVELISSNDSNFRLSTVDEREVGAARVDASANLEGAAERIRINIRPRVHNIDYSDDREYDRTDEYLYTSLRVGSERTNFTLSADIAQDGTLTNSLIDTGYTEVDADRDREIYGLDWAAATSERGTFFMNLAGESVEYITELVNSPLVDYDYASAGFGYAHQLSERGTFTFMLSGGTLDTGSPFADIENVGYSLQYERALSETLTMQLGAGQYETRRPNLPITADRDWTLDFSLDKRWDRWTLNTTLTAAVEPSAYGVLFRRESANLRVSRRFSEYVTVGMSVLAGHVISEQQFTFNEDRVYGRTSLDVDWRVAERLWLSFAAGLRGQEFVAVSDRARAVFGQVSFSYRGRGT